MMEHEMYDRQNTLVMYMNVLAFSCQIKTRNILNNQRTRPARKWKKAGRVRTDSQPAPSMDIVFFILFRSKNE